MKLHHIMKKERKKRKITLVKLAEKTGLSYGMIYRLEKGLISEPRVDVLHKVSKVLELNYLSVLKSFNYIDEDYVLGELPPKIGWITVNVINFSDIFEKQQPAIDTTTILAYYNVDFIA